MSTQIVKSFDWILKPTPLLVPLQRLKNHAPGRGDKNRISHAKGRAE